MSVDLTSTAPAVAAGPLTEQMWREVIAQLRAFVRRRIADPERAEDLVGEILLRIHQNLGSIDDRDRLTHWVSRVARNAVIDEYRRAARAREHLVPAPEDVVAIEDRDDMDDESAVLTDLTRCLHPLLDGLPAEQRSAVQMIDLEAPPPATRWAGRRADPGRVARRAASAGPAAPSRS